MKIRRILLLLLFILEYSNICVSQNRYGNKWILGYGNSGISGTLLDFNTKPVSLLGIEKYMLLHASSTVMCDSLGSLLFYSNGCYIAGADNLPIMNGDSIGHGKLASSFCSSIGSPLTQGILSLPLPQSSNLYYIFYLDIQIPYENPPGLYFAFAPTTLYYAVIDMNANQNKGEVVVKDQVIISDTLSRGMIQATKASNGFDWWILMPKSHSNCYYTIRLSSDGIDTTFLQCVGSIWDDEDRSGQVVFSPNSKQYARFNYFNGLNIFNFDNENGILSNVKRIDFGSDTFYYGGVAYSSNSKLLYATAFDKIYQFDIQSPNIDSSKTLIGELITPPNIQNKTRFNQSLLAPDGKIYIAGTGAHNYLHVIENPNCLGKDCNLNQYSIEMNTYNFYGLPNLPCYRNWSENDTCDALVNITETSFNSKVRIYPNPFTDLINFEFQNEFMFQLYNISGIRVYKGKIDINNYILNLTYLPEGLYFYNIVSDDKMISQGKLIKVDK